MMSDTAVSWLCFAGVIIASIVIAIITLIKSKVEG